MVAARFIGVQKGCGLVPDFPLYNVERAPVADLIGSTLALSTLRKLGDWPESSESLVIVRAHPQGGWTHAWLEQPGVSSCRVYRGWWPTGHAATEALANIKLT